MDVWVQINIGVGTKLFVLLSGFKLKKIVNTSSEQKLFLSSLFDQGLFDNQRGSGFGSGVNGH